ncbi:MAG: RES family NAD+ phosphorylase [Gammaproteobacteria bacterium]|nr:RES family NAD+ phosphorylase [Gammaproteobacteria bacterium]MCF6260319.1 RES family NAD+ phosphorylase [Gammaproteobacteria bacterium]
MQAYRLIKKKYTAEPLDPQGAKFYGGRWNSKGRSVIYASDSIALAALERLVHLHRTDVLNHFVLCTISFNNNKLMTLPEDVLPTDWRDDPPPDSTIDIGNEWLSSLKSLVLAVPSTVVPQQTNLLINPDHPDFANLAKSIIIEPFIFDPRLT